MCRIFEFFRKYVWCVWHFNFVHKNNDYIDRDYYQKKTNSQMEAVKNDLHRVEQVGNPIHRDHTTRVTRGGIEE